MRPGEIVSSVLQMARGEWKPPRKGKYTPRLLAAIRDARAEEQRILKAGGDAAVELRKELRSRARRQVRARARFSRELAHKERPVNDRKAAKRARMAKRALEAVL